MAAAHLIPNARFLVRFSLGAGRYPRAVSGRVERALDTELRGEKRIGPAARAALREQAKAVDVAAAEHDPHLVSEANRAYLDLRQAEGLTAGGIVETDTFGQLLAELSRPTTTMGHPEKP